MTTFGLHSLIISSYAHSSAAGRRANAKQPCRGKYSENEFIKSVHSSPEHNLQSNMLHCHYLITVISTLAPVNLLKKHFKSFSSLQTQQTLSLPKYGLVPNDMARDVIKEMHTGRKESGFGDRDAYTICNCKPLLAKQEVGFQVVVTLCQNSTMTRCFSPSFTSSRNQRYLVSWPAFLSCTVSW